MVETEEIMSELYLLKDKIEKNEQLYNLAEDDAIIEALIFEERALMLRYSRLIARAKEKGLNVPFINGR